MALFISGCSDQHSRLQVVLSEESSFRLNQPRSIIDAYGDPNTIAFRDEESWWVWDRASAAWSPRRTTAPIQGAGDIMQFSDCSNRSIVMIDRQRILTLGGDHWLLLRRGAGDCTVLDSLSLPTSADAYIRPYEANAVIAFSDPSLGVHVVAADRDVLQVESHPAPLAPDSMGTVLEGRWASGPALQLGRGRLIRVFSDLQSSRRVIVVFGRDGRVQASSRIDGFFGIASTSRSEQRLLAAVYQADGPALVEYTWSVASQ